MGNLGGAVTAKEEGEEKKKGSWVGRKRDPFYRV